MIYVAIFSVWALIVVVYLAAGARLIPVQHRVNYGLSPMNWGYVAGNLLWWLTPLSWLFTPSIPRGASWAMGANLFVFGAALAIWVRRVNPYFSPAIRRPPAIIRSGPYARLKHPGYVGFAVMACGSLLMLGHWLGIIPLACYVGLLVARARRENKLLYT